MADTAAPVKVTSRKRLLQALQNLGSLDVEIERRQLARAKAEAKLTARHDPTIAELQKAQKEQKDLIADYVRSNRTSLFGDESSVMTEAGEIAVQKLPARTIVSDEDSVIKRIKKRGRAFAAKYLRVKESVDVSALKKDGVTVRGVTIDDSREKVVITPITSGSKSTVEL